MDLEYIGNIPVSTSTVSSIFPEVKAGNQKVRNLETSGKIIRLKKGLYVVAPTVSRTALSTELIANHIYAPSYVSMSSALRYYGADTRNRIHDPIHDNQALPQFRHPVGTVRLPLYKARCIPYRHHQHKQEKPCLSYGDPREGPMRPYSQFPTSEPAVYQGRGNIS